MSSLHEPIQFQDADTGAWITRWTSTTSNAEHLYFTSESITEDDNFLLFMSDRDSTPNLYGLSRTTSQVFRLSNASELKRSYVYPEGGDFGFVKVSPLLDSKRAIAYWIEDDRLLGASLSSPTDVVVVGTLPPDWVPGYAAISPDGNSIAVPCTDPSGFDRQDANQSEQLRFVPKRVERNGLKTRVYLFDLMKSSQRLLCELPFWSTHVQFSPQKPGSIICNSEGAKASWAAKGEYTGRIWSIDRTGNFDLFFRQPTRQSVNHENWSPSGRCLVYHGMSTENVPWIARQVYRALRRTGLLSKPRRSGVYKNYIGALTTNGDHLWTIDTPIAVSHAIATTDCRTVVADSRDGFIYHVTHRDSDRPQLRKLCRHGSSMLSQDSHPHPKPTLNDRSVLFTSDFEGRNAVYEVPLLGDHSDLEDIDA